MSGSQVVYKVWGFEDWLVNNELYCAKHLWINPGFACSLHYHKEKDETFYVIHGKVLLEIGDETSHCTIELDEGEKYRINPGEVHRFRSGRSKDHALVLEVSTHHDDSDVYRLEESKQLCTTSLTSTSPESGKVKS